MPLVYGKLIASGELTKSGHPSRLFASEDRTSRRQDILIHGDPEGLRSLANVLLRIADLNQNDIVDLPIGAREHIHLRPKVDSSSSSQQVIIGRLDAKGTGTFYKGSIPR